MPRYLAFGLGIGAFVRKAIKMSLMNLIGPDCEAIISDYLDQLNYTDNLDWCMRQLKCAFKHDTYVTTTKETESYRTWNGVTSEIVSDPYENMEPCIFFEDGDHFINPNLNDGLTADEIEMYIAALEDAL